ncbi:MAG: stress response translation initiation inhibitor YciH [Bacteroidota bacterium]|nr:stress response translation initiation inhibitor YciH [Bacteroidota bacterium]MDP4234227.1 stress response translation initiation inhibitor YciH [Bacteroidota bacterium]MDP4243417.1 stress response translation initiation inhibitor YciH [Bacteroidota bacterium]MDP4288116.1 stress response translation initiation inhibitor YciH [Bacteroidota bacterium]
MKLTDLTQLSGLLTAEQSAALEKERALRASKRKIGEGQDVQLYIDRKARRGKSVTIVAGLRLSTEMRDKLAKDLKHLVSAGGTVYQDTIELQGEHISRILEYLKENGFRVKTK